MTVGKSNAFGRRLTDRRSGRKKPFALTSEIPRERKPVQLTLRLDLQEARQHNFRSRADRRHYPLRNPTRNSSAKSRSKSTLLTSRSGGCGGWRTVRASI
jgi:hypothetical protein